MSKSSHFAPDVTLSLDGDGVIQAAVPAESLAGESIDKWRGRRWTDVVPSEAAEHVEQAVSSARYDGGSPHFVVNQLLPSGRELRLEYTMVKLGDSGSLIAIGKNVNAITEVTNRLANIQREREQDYWRLRDIETRYRALLDASSEAVVLVRAANMRVVESNPAATRLLGLVPGAEFLPSLGGADRQLVQGLFDVVRLEGRAPGVMLHLVSEDTWSLRASMLTGEGGPYYLLQMEPLPNAEPVRPAGATFSIEDFFARLPEGFAVVDREGVVKLANATFADLVQIGLESAVIGQNARRWLSNSGAGLREILDLAEQHGLVRSLRTTLEGELGGTLDVEITAIGDRPSRSRYFALLVRDVVAPERKASGGVRLPAIGDLSEASLGEMVRSSVEAIEREKIVDALGTTAGKRTMAAKALGLSRQGLYAKMKRYKLQ